MTATWDDGLVILYIETLTHNQLQDFTPTTPGTFPLSLSQRQLGCKKILLCTFKKKKMYVVSRKSQICLICLKQQHLIHFMAVVISVSQHTLGKWESSPLIWYLNSITLVQVYRTLNYPTWTHMFLCVSAYVCVCVCVCVITYRSTAFKGLNYRSTINFTFIYTVENLLQRQYVSACVLMHYLCLIYVCNWI